MTQVQLPDEPHVPVPASRLDRAKSGLDLLATVAVMVVCTVAAWSRLRATTEPHAPTNTPPPPTREMPVPSVPVSLKDAALLGDTHARVALVGYSDFECPFCRRFATETLPTIERDYVTPGKVLLAYRNMPLPIHAHAFQAAVSAECARRQGKYWDMHRRLFGTPPSLDQAAMLDDAGRIGLDLRAFEACLAGDASAAVQADVDQGKAVGVVGTPAFLVGLVQADGSVKVLHALRGALPIDRFRQALDDALRAGK